MKNAMTVKTWADLGDSAICYACDAPAIGLADRRFSPEEDRPASEPAGFVPACARHAEARLRPALVCALCCGPARRGSLVIDAEIVHGICQREASRD